MRLMAVVMFFVFPSMLFAQGGNIGVIDPGDPDLNINQTNGSGRSLNQNSFKVNRTPVPGTYNRNTENVLSNTGEYSGIYYKDLQGAYERRQQDGDTVKLRYYDINGRPIELTPTPTRPATPMTAPSTTTPRKQPSSSPSRQLPPTRRTP